jgi:hypothetical protein
VQDLAEVILDRAADSIAELIADVFVLSDDRQPEAWANVRLAVGKLVENAIADEVAERLDDVPDCREVEAAINALGTYRYGEAA